jgi:hypothetical protein
MISFASASAFPFSSKSAAELAARFYTDAAAGWDDTRNFDSLVKTPKWAKNGSPSARNHWGENLENGFLRVNQFYFRP